MIDIHSHLLPGLDDGSRSVERSLEVLRGFAGAGVQGVVLTPHLDASAIVGHGEQHLALRAGAYERLMDGVGAGAGIAGAGDVPWPALYLGFEILLDEPLPVSATRDRRFALARSRYYLVEFRLAVPADFAARELRRIAASGVVPLVAHPERYDACRPEVVADWRAAGARIQVDATTLTKPTPRGRKARELVAAGVADLLAADNHGDGRSVAVARRYLEEHGHADAAKKLTELNPRAVVEDQEMVEVPPAVIRESIVTRLRKLFSG